MELTRRKESTKWGVMVREKCPDLRVGRHKGYGPPFIKLSPRQVRYRRDAVLAWLQERTYRSTAENLDPARMGLSPGQPRRGSTSH